MGDVRQNVMLQRFALILLAVCAAIGQEPAARQAAAEDTGRWIVVLEETPVAAQVASRAELGEQRAALVRQQIVSRQARLGRELDHLGMTMLDSTQVILNALFVRGSSQQAEAASRIPGVAAVVPATAGRRSGNAALPLVQAQKAWNTAFRGGETAGDGTRIGIIDTGIDHSHPAFNDAGFAEPAGGRLCRQSDGECDFTNRKIIAVRSYVRLLAEADDPLYTRPDDLSPRDRVGHGTAVAMLAGGVLHDSPIGTLSGVAPKAWLGSYKVFGSPGVNDVTFDFVVMKALEDALLDGMDAVTLSLGFPAVFGPNDTVGNGCTGSVQGRPCDPWIATLANVRRLGMAVIVAAGNEGDLSLNPPARNSITSPGTSPDVITVGSSGNAHRLYNFLNVESAAAPDLLRPAAILFGNGPRPAEPLTARMIDVTTLDGNGQACSSLARGSLGGAIAFVQAGGCSTRVKVNNAAQAGARAVLLMRAEGYNFLFSPGGLQYTAIPLALMGNERGKALKEFLSSQPDARVTLNPAWMEVKTTEFADVVSYFSSVGPAIGTNEIKPDLVAPGEHLYVATQRFDPAGDMFSPAGYTMAQGSSFSVGIVAGAVALSRQLFPNLGSIPESERAGVLKSSVVNTANPDLLEETPEQTYRDAFVVSMGSGLLDLDATVRSALTVSPTAVNFGALGERNFPVTRTLIFRNHDTREITVNLRAQRYVKDDDRTITITPSQFTIRANSASQQVQVVLGGLSPVPPGMYDGTIQVSANGAAAMQIPFLYMVTDGVPYNLLPLRNYDFVGQAGRRLSGGLLFKVVDKQGLPVPNVPVQWTYSSGGGDITEAYPSISNPRTDPIGIAEATTVWLGESLGEHRIEAKIPDLPAITFIGAVRLQPVIENGGVVNAASGALGNGLAPGSIVSIFGRGLSEITLASGAGNLPLSLGGISVSFDDPERKISLPGRMVAVSDGRVDVQLPWELEGLASVVTKVSLDGFTNTTTYRVPLANYGPAWWTARDPETDEVWIDARDSNGARITSSNRVRRGALVKLRANGLGPVTNLPASGEAPATELSSTLQGSISVKLGEREVPVESASLLAGAVGIYEVVVRMPEDLAAGRQVPVSVTVAGVSSPAANLPIQE
jgi:uncharacterized protein (TIGR03437 family)